MHMLIRVLVPAADATEAVGVARFPLDRLIGIGEGASTAFDYLNNHDHFEVLCRCLRSTNRGTARSRRLPREKTANIDSHVGWPTSVVIRSNNS
jgi:hypothetical protein